MDRTPDQMLATLESARTIADATSCGTANVPEVFLAREAQMAYATVCLVTDYDCWLEDSAQHVSVGAIFERYGQTLALVRQVLDELLLADPPQPAAVSREALRSALLTPDAALSPDRREWLRMLRA